MGFNPLFVEAIHRTAEIIGDFKPPRGFVKEPIPLKPLERSVVRASSQFCRKCTPFATPKSPKIPCRKYQIPEPASLTKFEIVASAELNTNGSSFSTKATVVSLRYVPNWLKSRYLWNHLQASKAICRKRLVPPELQLVRDKFDLEPCRTNTRPDAALSYALSAR